MRSPSCMRGRPRSARAALSSLGKRGRSCTQRARSCGWRGRSAGRASARHRRADRRGAGARRLRPRRGGPRPRPGETRLLGERRARRPDPLRARARDPSRSRRSRHHAHRPRAVRIVVGPRLAQNADSPWLTKPATPPLRSRRPRSAPSPAAAGEGWGEGLRSNHRHAPTAIAPSPELGLRAPSHTLSPRGVIDAPSRPVPSYPGSMTLPSRGLYETLITRPVRRSSPCAFSVLTGTRSDRGRPRGCATGPSRNAGHDQGHRDDRRHFDRRA